jgi:undecaprenyl diphosphate synthase
MTSNCATGTTLGARGGLHVGIIMDGNGRWAQARGWPRSYGHLAGAEAVRRVVKAAPRLGIGTLTLYAFSSDNWRRPREEVDALLALLRRYLETEREELAAEGVRCEAIGRRDRLGAELQAAIAAMEQATREGRKLRLRLALDYSARGEMARAGAEAAARWTTGLAPNAETMRRLMEAALEGECGAVDLLIRCGGEKRLSDFMLWEVAYAELVFLRTMWPEFGARELRRAVRIYAQRERRFGGQGTDAAARTRRLAPAAAGA